MQSQIEELLLEQGRVKLENGGWSEKPGGLDIGTGKVSVEPFFPNGALAPNWKPCELVSLDSDESSGERCEPYREELWIELWDGDKLTKLGEWAPPIVVELTRHGLDWGVWTANYPDVCFLTMCRKCGMSITGMMDLENPTKEIEWEAFTG